MYDELVKQLRDNAEFLVKASSGYLSNSFAETMSQAADAIEELQKRVPKRPHGRLIDADANLAVMRKVLDAPYTSNGEIDTAMLRACILMFKEAPTVIEAEEGE